MQPRHLCNSSWLSAGCFGVRAEGLGRKPVVWESGACSGWELLPRLVLQPWVSGCVSLASVHSHCSGTSAQFWPREEF